MDACPGLLHAGQLKSGCDTVALGEFVDESLWVTGDPFVLVNLITMHTHGNFISCYYCAWSPYLLKNVEFV